MDKDYFINLFYAIGSNPFSQSISSFFKGIGAIFCYHSISNYTPFPLGPNHTVRTSRFEDQIEFIASHFFPCPLSQLLLERKIKKGFPVSITIDDGYKDSITNAFPILEKYHIPATIFISTAFIESNPFLWWYDLDQILHGCKDISFTFCGKEYKWDISVPSNYFRAKRKLTALLKNLVYKDQCSIYSQICPDYTKIPPPDRFLSWSDIQTLNQHPLISIGCHSHSHANLNMLPINSLKTELFNNKSILTSRLGEFSNIFSLPFGHKPSPLVKKTLQDAGFSAAVSLSCYPLKRPFSKFNVPRLIASNNDTPHRSHIKLGGWPAMWRKNV